MTTQGLLEALRTGDRAAGEQLERAFREPLLRFCGGYLPHPEDAEDAVQEIFAKLLRAGAVPEDLRAWIFRVARNHCLNDLRARGNRRDAAPLPTSAELPHSATGALTRMARVEDHERVAEALQLLPEATRTALLLRYNEDLSREEIGQVLDLPVSVVKSRLYEGMKKLRERVAGVSPDQGVSSS